MNAGFASGWCARAAAPPRSRSHTCRDPRRGSALFVKVVAVAAVVRRDGRIQAAGHPADHARLGAIEQQDDELAGPGAIDEIAAQATLPGKVKDEARRAMTAALTIRATVLMSVMPGADYSEVMAALLGDLVRVPWHRPYRVPTGKVLPAGREALGPHRWPVCRHGCWPPSMASTATTTTGPCASG